MRQGAKLRGVGAFSASLISFASGVFEKIPLGGVDEVDGEHAVAGVGGWVPREDLS